MKNFKLTILGVVTLLIALTLNFRHALDNYGISKNKLHVEVLAQSNGSGGSSSGGGDSSGGGSSSPKGPVNKTEIRCFGSTTTKITLYENGKTSNGWIVSGGAAVGYKAIGANFDAMYNKNNENGSGGQETSITISNWDFTAFKYLCTGQNSNNCNPFDPCPGF